MSSCFLIVAWYIIEIAKLPDKTATAELYHTKSIFSRHQIPYPVIQAVLYCLIPLFRSSLFTYGPPGVYMAMSILGKKQFTRDCGNATESEMVLVLESVTACC